MKSLSARSLATVVSAALVACDASGGAGGDLITADPGELPVVLSAPHGGTERMDGVPTRSDGTTVRDAETYELSLAVRDALESSLGERPSLVAARVAREQVDLNRAPDEAYEHPAAVRAYDAFHEALESAAREAVERGGECALLVDIHGQSYGSGTVYRGTRGGRTADLDALYEEGAFMWALSGSTLDISPEGSGGFENLFFNGGYIVGTYGRDGDVGLDAVQLEIGSSYRNPEVLADTAAALATAIESHVRTRCAR